MAMTLHLDPAELEALERVLLQSINDLDVELGHTDSHDFKERLKHRKTLMAQVLNKVRATAQPA